MTAILQVAALHIWVAMAGPKVRKDHIPGPAIRAPNRNGFDSADACATRRHDELLFS
jgi:hypothetical protein